MSNFKWWKLDLDQLKLYIQNFLYLKIFNTKVLITKLLPNLIKDLSQTEITWQETTPRDNLIPKTTPKQRQPDIKDHCHTETNLTQKTGPTQTTWLQRALTNKQPDPKTTPKQRQHDPKRNYAFWILPYYCMNRERPVNRDHQSSKTTFK